MKRGRLIGMLLLGACVLAIPVLAEDSPAYEHVRLSKDVPRDCLDKPGTDVPHNGWLVTCSLHKADDVWNFYETRNFRKEIFTASRKRSETQPIAGYYVKQDGSKTRVKTRMVEETETVNMKPAVAVVSMGREQLPPEKPKVRDRWEYLRPTGGEN